ncbi:MAG: winged helix-turn-helix transcriptional regulator [Campylobacterales bacterium]|nr:winged helix-turn-helix transcriptional regulator [Campylobacterales bacterium]
MDLEEKVKIFKALGNDTRLKIFQNVLHTPYICSVNKNTKSDDIIQQATCVGTIASEFNYSLPAISRHLKELKEAKLITMSKVANKIYVEPNFKTINMIAECFENMKVKIQEMED